MNDQRKHDQEPEPATSGHEQQPEQVQTAELEQSESTDRLASDNEPAAEATIDKGKSMRGEDRHRLDAAPSKAGKSWAVLALLIALLAMVLASYPYWPWQIPGFPIPNDRNEALNELRQDLDQLQRQQTSMQRELERRIDRQQHSIGELGDALQEVQQNAANAASQGLLDEDLDARIVSQVQSLLQTELAAQSEWRQELQAALQAQLNERLDALLADLDGRIEVLQGRQAEAESGASDRMRAFESRNREQLDQMSARLEAVAQELDDTGQNVSERLLLVQVEALLALGQDRLELDGDAVGAGMAFQRAVERLQTQEIAGFAALQQSIQRERNLIEQYLEDDSELSADQRFARLNEMAEQVPEWPVHDEIALSSTQSGSAEEADGWGARVGQALSGLVRIENVEQAGPSAPETEQAQMRIQQALRTAALAAARQDWDLNQALIEAAQKDMHAALNTDAAVIDQAMDELDALKTEPDTSRLPSLGRAREQVISLLERLQ